MRFDLLLCRAEFRFGYGSSAGLRDATFELDSDTASPLLVVDEVLDAWNPGKCDGPTLTIGGRCGSSCPTALGPVSVPSDRILAAVVDACGTRNESSGPSAKSESSMALSSSALVYCGARTGFDDGFGGSRMETSWCDRTRASASVAVSLRSPSTHAFRAMSKSSLVGGSA